MKDFEQRLTGGHPNSLGNTIEVVNQVLDNHALFDELFNCYFSNDEIVRLRTSNGVKRVCLAQPQLVVPYIDRLLTEIAHIDQPSTQWTLALLFGYLKEQMSTAQLASATAILKRNLETNSDWIVINNTIETLAQWSKDDPTLSAWLIPQLRRFVNEPRKSIARRAQKWLEKLQ